MEFPEPTIDVDAEAEALLTSMFPSGLDRQLTIAEAAAGVAGLPKDRPGLPERIRGLLAQAWEEGRWSPPGACLNPYGAPALANRPKADQQGFPGLRLLKLREAAQAALAWVENMSPTVKRTALANQLREALGGK